jgi:hypothetical protein
VYTDCLTERPTARVREERRQNIKEEEEKKQKKKERGM